MTPAEFAAALDARIAKYDLLCHPFYKAWSEGQLTRDDLRDYALDYHEHVKAFPTYLAELAVRLEDGETRRAVLANMTDELGRSTAEPAHAELWMDFAQGMGAHDKSKHQPMAEIMHLVSHFNDVASQGTPEEALAAFYAYESQVPRIATEKERGLRAWYGADDKTCRYFTLHSTADVYHAQVWRKLLEKNLETNPEAPQAMEKALAAAEAAAKALWTTLDSMEARRQAAIAA